MALRRDCSSAHGPARRGQILPPLIPQVVVLILVHLGCKTLAANDLASRADRLFKAGTSQSGAWTAVKCTAGHDRFNTGQGKRNYENLKAFLKESDESPAVNLQIMRGDYVFCSGDYQRDAIDRIRKGDIICYLFAPKDPTNGLTYTDNVRASSPISSHRPLSDRMCTTGTRATWAAGSKRTESGTSANGQPLQFTG